VKRTRLAAIAAGVLIGITAAVASTAAWLGERKLQRRVAVRVVPVAFARDAASVQRGAQIYEVRGCGGCHGPDGTGRVVIDGERGLFVRAPNLTAGPRGIASDYSEADWVRAIRHGVAADGRALLFMPSEEYNRMTDSELAAVVAYVRALPPAAGEAGEVRLPFHLRALYGLGLMADASEKIDHRKPPAP